MENYWIILFIPVLWFLGTLLFQLCHLVYLWTKFKFEEITIWLEGR